MKEQTPSPGLHKASDAARAVARCLLALLSLCVFAGCEDVKREAEGEDQIATEQAAIRAYAAKVPEVDQRLATFLEAWARANEQRDVKGLKEDLSANVKPALAAHLDALAGMPTGSPALAAIHAPLVAAYREASAAFDHFVAVVTEANLDEEYAKLIGAMDQVKVAEEAYYKALTAHHAAHRVTLKPAP